MHFREKIISYVIKICFLKLCSNKIFIALILNRKSCICCRKHCIAYFRRHMECAVLKRFLKVQGTFLKKFLQTHFSIWKKLNLIRFIKTFIKALFKGFTPHLLRLRLSTFSSREKLKPSVKLRLPPSLSGRLLATILYLIPKYRDLSRYFTESFDQTFSKVRQGLG